MKNFKYFIKNYMNHLQDFLQLMNVKELYNYMRMIFQVQLNG